ncbi:MAG: protein kinase domain-containing protein, partial [Candidatus Acidiferrales bacterium]
ADALDKAHRQGVVHRDLKPGNIMLTKSGAKLLDFGLAKPATNLVASALSQYAPTVTQSPSQPLTEAGTIVGTFHYMAPEQLEGREADARSDIFSFGAVLYEMAAGRKAFPGKTQASAIAAVLTADPTPISQLQPLTPPALERVVRICLEKDPDERWQTAHDLKLQLQWIAEGGSLAGVPAPVVARRKHWQWAAWGVAALALLLAATGAFGALYYSRAVREASRPVQATLLPPENASFGPIALSPDGRRLAFTRGPGGRGQLWIRPMDSLTAQPLAGTEGAAFPFWSPDSRFVGFFAQGKLKKIEASGGPPQTLADAALPRGGTWSSTGVILFAPDTTVPLHQVPVAGGQPTPLTKLNPDRQEITHRWPYFLPDGRHFLFLASSSGQVENTGIYLGSLDGTEPKRLLGAASPMAYAPPGYLLFVREATLMAQTFDAKQLELRGDPFPVAEQVQFIPGLSWGNFAVSNNGVLVYQTGRGATGVQVAWYDRAGKKNRSLPESGFYNQPRLAPDGKRLAAMFVDPATRNLDVWVYDLARGTRTRLTFDAAADNFPVWSPDGRFIIFASDRKGNFDLYQKDSSGAAPEEALLESEARERPSSWSSDGRFLAFDRAAPGGDDLWVLSLTGERKAFPVLVTPFDDENPMFSPNGRWMAYQSNESGSFEIYAIPFRLDDKGQPVAQPAGKWQVSTSGGYNAAWRRDGQELYYLSEDNKVMVVAVAERGSSLELGVPRPLFDVSPSTATRPFTVYPDGRLFVLTSQEETAFTAPVTVVLHWTSALP